MLVARAFSNGNDLELVLYPGAQPGPQNIRIERLRAGANYAMRNGSEHAFTADNSGAASLSVELHGRTPIISFPQTDWGSGDHLLAQECLYGGGLDLITQNLPRLGIEVDLVMLTSQRRGPRSFGATPARFMSNP